MNAPCKHGEAAALRCPECLVETIQERDALREKLAKAEGARDKLIRLLKESCCRECGRETYWTHEPSCKSEWHRGIDEWHRGIDVLSEPAPAPAQRDMTPEESAAFYKLVREKFVGPIKAPAAEPAAKACPACGGDGERETGSAPFETLVTCLSCNGSGKVKP